MEKRKTCSLALAFLLGIAAAEYRQAVFWVVLFLFGLTFIGSVYRSGQQPTTRCLWMALWIVAAVFGIFTSYSRQKFRESYMFRLKDGETCLVQGTIYQKEESKTDCQYFLKHCILQLNGSRYPCNSILLHLKAESYPIGKILSVQGTIQTFALPANEGGYQEQAYYESINIDFAIKKARVLSVHGKTDPIRNRLYDWKARIAQSYQTAMPDNDAGVLIAMALGDKSHMDPDRKQRYQSAGISHFYSISGLHISMLGMAWYHILKKRGTSILTAGGTACVFLLGYGALIGFGVSASRAIGMFLLLMYAKYRGRSYDRATALACTAAWLAADNPGLLHHAGYLLSFGAVTGILLSEWILPKPDISISSTRPQTVGNMAEFMGRQVKGVQAMLLASLCIQLVTIPILCQFFYEISLYAVWINLAVLPCMGVLLGFGIAGGIAGCTLPFLGKLLLYPCHIILGLFDALCTGCLKLPCASLITGALPLGKLLFWYGCILVFLAVKSWKPTISVCLICLPFCCLLFPATTAFELDILDVGQGDGIYLSTGDGTSVFIDGGSSNIANVGQYRILPFLKYRGIRQMDYWFVSHCDADHINGLTEVMASGYPIKNLVVAQAMPQDEAWQDLQHKARQYHIPIRQMDAGDALACEDWKIQCLAPKAGAGTKDRNANSLVLFYKDSVCSAFLAGDIGEEQERALLQNIRLPQADIYKASHHGSNTSNCMELLQTLKPDIAVISCALQNRYGHPGDAALKRLRMTGGRIYETRYMGQIKITDVHLDDGVETMLKYTYENN